MNHSTDQDFRAKPSHSLWTTTLLLTTAFGLLNLSGDCVLTHGQPSYHAALATHHKPGVVWPTNPLDRVWTAEFHYQMEVYNFGISPASPRSSPDQSQASLRLSIKDSFLKCFLMSMAKATGIWVQPNCNIPTLKQPPLPETIPGLWTWKILAPILEAWEVESCAKAKSTVSWIYSQQSSLAHGHTCKQWDFRAPLMVD